MAPTASFTCLVFRDQLSSSAFVVALSSHSGTQGHSVSCRLCVFTVQLFLTELNKRTCWVSNIVSITVQEQKEGRVTS